MSLSRTHMNTSLRGRVRSTCVHPDIHIRQLLTPSVTNTHQVRRLVVAAKPTRYFPRNQTVYSESTVKPWWHSQPTQAVAIWMTFTMSTLTEEPAFLPFAGPFKSLSWWNVGNNHFKLRTRNEEACTTHISLVNPVSTRAEACEDK